MNKKKITTTTIENVSLESPSPERWDPEEVVVRLTVNKESEAYQAKADAAREKESITIQTAREVAAGLGAVWREHGSRISRRQGTLTAINLDNFRHIRNRVESCRLAYVALSARGTKIPHELQGYLDDIARVRGDEVDPVAVVHASAEQIRLAIGKARPGHLAADIIEEYRNEIAKADELFEALAKELERHPELSHVYPTESIAPPVEPVQRHAQGPAGFRI